MKNNSNLEVNNPMVQEKELQKQQHQNPWAFFPNTNKGFIFLQDVHQCIQFSNTANFFKAI